MLAIISRVTSFGATAPGISTAPITRSASSTDAATCRLELISSVTRPERISSRWRMRSIERSRIVTCAPSPSAMIGGVVADDPAADDHDAAGATPGHAAEQQPAPAERLLEEVRARLRGEPAGDLRHRREQRQRAPDLDRLVGDRGDAGRRAARA